MLVAIVAGFTSENVNAFFGNDRYHYQSGDGIGPPPTEDRIENEAGKKNRREIRAKIGLPGVGLQRVAMDIRRDPPFCSREQRHYDKRKRCDAMPRYETAGGS